MTHWQRAKARLLSAYHRVFQRLYKLWRQAWAWLRNPSLDGIIYGFITLGVQRLVIWGVLATSLLLAGLWLTGIFFVLLFLTDAFISYHSLRVLETQLLSENLIMMAQEVLQPT